MSITLGGYTVETKKTVGELPLGSDDILAEQPCTDPIDTNNVQPKFKRIHQYDINLTASPFIGGFEIPSGYYILPDDVFADGYDYKVSFTFAYNGLGLTTILAQQFSYTIGSVFWFQFVDAAHDVIMNESNCAGSYANTSRALNLHATSPSAFTLDITVTIEQLIPATIEIELCGGGTLINTTELEEISEVIEVYVEGSEEPIEVNSTKRNSTYDPYGLGFDEAAKMPKTCLGYSVYYIGSLFSSPYNSPNEKTYWLDSGIYQTKINIPKIPPQILDFKLYDGSTYVFNEPSDLNGLIDWIAFTPTGGTNTDLEIWDGAIQETLSGEQYVYFKYDLNEYDCPCTDCGTDCGEITVIFHQNCGNSFPLKFNLMIQEGKYNVEGETFTQGDALITPITKIHATYDFVISEYSDETYLLLMNLIADNILIEVVDNIDMGNPTTEYYINKEAFAPNWNFNSKLGSLTLPVIKKDSIRTSRRNCCN